MRQLCMVVLVFCTSFKLTAQADQIKTLKILVSRTSCEAFVSSSMRLKKGEHVLLKGELPENFWLNPLSTGKVIAFESAENVIVNGVSLIRKGASAVAQIQKITYVERGYNRGAVAQIFLEIEKITACDCSSVKLEGLVKLDINTREISILSQVSESKVLNTSF